MNMLVCEIGNKCHVGQKLRRSRQNYNEKQTNLSPVMNDEVDKSLVRSPRRSECPCVIADIDRESTDMTFLVKGLMSGIF